MQKLASLCDDLAGCAGFNSNGWAKQRILSLPALTNTTACDLYVRNGGPAPPRVYPPGPSGAPVPARNDIHYPAEESFERASNPPPRFTVISVSSDSTCAVTVSGHSAVVLVPGVVPSAIVNSTVAWFAHACVANGDANRGAMVVLGQTFRRWSRLVYANSSTVVADLRVSVGAAESLAQPRYNFTAAEPKYFDRAQREYGDYLGRRIRNGSAFGEPEFGQAIRYIYD